MRLSVVLLAAMFGGAPLALAQQTHQNAVIDLWAQGKPAFGVYAPNEHPGPEASAASRRSLRSTRATAARRWR